MKEINFRKDSVDSMCVEFLEVPLTVGTVLRFIKNQKGLIHVAFSKQRNQPLLLRWEAGLQKPPNAFVQYRTILTV